MSSLSPDGPPPPPLPDWLTTPPAAVIALLAAILFVKLQNIVPTLFDHDGYYHIKVAELFWREGFLQSFPWAAFSLFREHYGDKEFLFHVALLPFTWLGLIPGAKLATVLLDVAIVTLTYQLLRAHRVRGAALWTLLFLGASSLFFWRMGQCRPHLGSILCVMAGLHALARRNLRALVIVSAVYALAYTASHVIVILASIAAVIHRRYAPRVAIELPLVALLGLCLGHTLHPNFPHNLAIWKVQNIDFYTFAWAKDLLGLGTEIVALSPTQFLRSNFLFLALWTVIGVASLRRWRDVRYETAVFAAGAAAFAVMAYKGARFTEYFVPLSVLALGMLAHDTGLSRPEPDRKRWGQAGLALAGAMLALSTWLNMGDVLRHLNALAPARELYDSSMREMSAILAQEAPGEIVYHSAWSDSPALLLFNDRSRYLVVLDPIYLYMGDRTRYMAYRALNEGGELPAALRPLTPAGFPERLEVVPTLRDLFQTRFVVARMDHRGLVEALSRAPGVRLRFKSITHALFELPR